MASVKTWLIPKDQGAEYRRDIAFAHIEIDLRNRFDQNIWETTDVATLAWNQVNSRKSLSQHIHIATYQEFSTFLHKSREPQGLGLYASCELQGWTFEHETTQTVIFYIDPLLSAECALAMLGTVHWATVICDAVPTDEDMIKSMERDLKEETEQQIVVCFSPWDWIQDSHWKNNQGLRYRLKMFFVMSPSKSRGNTMSRLSREKAALCFTFPLGYRHPFPLAEFEQIHLCLTTFREQTIFDPYTEQMARIRLLTSEEERREQVALAFRTSNVPLRVAVYCDQGTIDHFVEFGASERRLKIHNGHAPGFLLALVCRSDEDVSGAEKGFFNLLGTTLHERTSLVQKLLPIVDFDHRLAVFVARPTHSAKVLKVKLQLAAILVTGIERLFSVAPRGNMPYEEYNNSLVNTCQGWTCLLSHTGSMWLAVGLWKDGTAAVERLDKSAAGTYLIDKRLCLSYIPVLPDSLPETGGLSESESDEIREHLAWAYLHQVVQTKRALNGEIFHRLLNGTRDIYSITLPPWTFDESDFNALLADDIPYYNDGSHDDRIFGIFHGMSREFVMSNFYLDDWNYIPGYIICKAHENSQYYDLEDLTDHCTRDPEEQKALSRLPE
ncbi:hypothetical protein FMEXI_5055 [Fusarium mexicanum]|uniref:Uncharacterized protein n=1 Tax=Fusarium mexicanum TaxID=751941 RepID=A0A8H5J2P5_9HYPO|nr:hypothetical protein FMEXI_5055 [Fusarium mexicanum]